MNTKPDFKCEVGFFLNKDHMEKTEVTIQRSSNQLLMMYGMES